MVGLQDILSNKQSRGAFGEIAALADLVRDVLPAANYEFQATLPSGKRVDCLLKLPNPPGSIAIDAKFPLEAYRGLREAKDDIATKLAQREFTTAIRTHVKAIAEKYIVAGVTADSALMFLPSEAVYAELHSNFPNLVEEAGQARSGSSPPPRWRRSPPSARSCATSTCASRRMSSRTRFGELLQDVRRLDERVFGRLQSHFGQVNEDVRQILISTDKVTKEGGQIDAVELEQQVTPAALPERIPG